MKKNLVLVGCGVAVLSIGVLVIKHKLCKDDLSAYDRFEADLNK